MKSPQAILAIAALGWAFPAAADEALFAEAEAYEESGDIAAMQRTYEAILAQEPGNVRALVGRASALAWQGEYAAAEGVYADALAREPANVDALTGLAHAEAWGGDYGGALETFAAARALAPDSPHVLKGEAFVYLWSGDYLRAESAFGALAEDYPSDPEILTALGQARLHQGSSRTAIVAFDQALVADPTLDAARAGRLDAFGAPPAFEIGAWYGSTSNADSGLRQVELAYWLKSRTRIFGRYDDSLSLDNPALARAGQSAETWIVGAAHRLGDAWMVAGDAGVRQLPDGDQDLYHGEAVWSGSRLKLTLGAQVGNHDLGYDDTLTYVGVGIPLGPRWSLEVNNYFSETGVDGDDERRSILNAEYKARAGWSVLVGAGSGDVDSVQRQTNETVKVSHAVAFIPVGGYHRLNVTYRHEELAGESFDIAMLGFTFRLARD